MMDYDDEEGQYSAVIRSEPTAKGGEGKKKGGDTVIKRSDIQGKREPNTKKPAEDAAKKPASAEQPAVKAPQAAPLQETPAQPAQVKPPEASPKIVPADKPVEKPRELNPYHKDSKFILKFQARTGVELRSEVPYETYCLKENASKWEKKPLATAPATGSTTQGTTGATKATGSSAAPASGAPKNRFSNAHKAATYAPGPKDPALVQPVQPPMTHAGYQGPDMMSNPYFGYQQPMMYPPYPVQLPFVRDFT